MKKISKIQLSDFQINVMIASIIVGALIGFAMSNYYFYKNIEYQNFKEIQEKNQVKPNISIDVYNKDYIAFVIRTPNNLEIIEKLRMEFVVDGLVTEMAPRGNIINGEPCVLEKRPFFSVNDIVQQEKVIIKCDDVLPSVLNGVVIRYKKNHVVDFNENIDVEFYWKYKGQTQIEKFKISRD